MIIEALVLIFWLIFTVAFFMAYPVLGVLMAAGFIALVMWAKSGK